MYIYLSGFIRNCQRLRSNPLKSEKTMKRGQIKDEYYLYNIHIHHNSIDVYTHADYFLRIDCNKAEEELKTTSCSECALNTLAADESFEYVRLYFDGNMPMWVDVEDSLEVWQ